MEFDNYISIFVLIASIVWRISNKKHIFNKKDYYSDFQEFWCSGSGARGPLLCVTIKEKYLLIQLHFPFTLMFCPEIFRTEKEISLDDIIEVKKYFKSCVLITFNYKGKTIKRYVKVKNVDLFISKLGFSD